MRKTAICIGVCLALQACGIGDESDGSDEPLLVDGKADVGGVVDGSADACGVFKLVNEASLEVLDEDVGLKSSTAQALVDYRNGPDLLADTGDERRFDSMQELAGVIRKGAFQKILRYAQKKRYTCVTFDLGVLSVSDWHGQLDPLSVPMVGNVGGAPALATIFETERTQNPNTLTLTAGDGFGATPPLASFFEERPAVQAMNLMRFDADGVGNHNFDRGVAHLQSMIELAEYPYLSANLEHVAENLTCPSKPGGRCIEPYRNFYVGGLKVAVIGVTNPDAPSLTKPGSFGSIMVTNPAVAALAAREAAAAEGAQVFILIAHMGFLNVVGDEATGPIVELANAVHGFDLILADHTNVPANLVVNGQRVVENRSFGQTYARAQLVYDFATGRVTSTSAELVTPLSDGVTPDPRLVDLLAPYRTELAAAFDRVIAGANGVFERGMNVERLREVALGDLLADAIRLRYGAQVGFVNSGGIRAPLPSSYNPVDHALRRPAQGYAEGLPYDLVVGDAYAVLPFGNAVVTQTITGANLWAALEHGLGTLPAPAGRFPQISGIRVTFDSSRPAGSRVHSVTLDDGTPIANDDATYTLATADFLAAGGDGYTMLTSASGVSREKMAAILAENIEMKGSLTPVTDGRLTDVASPMP